LGEEVMEKGSFQGQVIGDGEMKVFLDHMRGKGVMSKFLLR
jgi:hypothetical protein